MEKHEKVAAWEEDAMKQALQKAAEAEQIPESLHPKQMEAWLKDAAAKKGQPQQHAAETKKACRRWWYGAVAAACLAIALIAAGRSIDWSIGIADTEDRAVEDGENADMDSAASEEPGSLQEGLTYEELYQAFCQVWDQQESRGYSNGIRGDKGEDEIAYLGEGVDAASDSYDSADGASIGGGELEETVSQEMAADQAEGGSGNYGKTNLQETGVEEADIIKNDGRYLYTVVSTDFEFGKETIQITDTKDGLQRIATIDEFEEGQIQDMYVWKDALVVVEAGWAAIANGNTAEDPSTEAVAYASFTVPFSKIHIYDIKDRSHPQKYHEFTVKGSYEDSRISDGYLYLFAGYTAYRPQMEINYKAYIPEIDNEPLDADSIYLPEKMEDTSYLVMASICMEQPDAFTDAKAIVASAEDFYVSKGNIYVINRHYIDYSKEGLQSDSTSIYRFSYQGGKMEKEAEGTVPGTLRDDFAMNEYKGCLRMVTTLNEQELENVTDDICEEPIGYLSSDTSTSNSLYILDLDLNVVGKIEDIAKGEQIYSARFLGDTGYFVTFRQVDPLFSVDLSDPQNPKILGELKISGFSEYLHFYAEGLLLGIGMEADEATGATEGMKLTMFDIEDPTNVKEQFTLNLPDFDYASALYNYKSVFIDTDKNLFGFCAEKYAGDEDACQYLLFSYEDGKFQKRLVINCMDLEMDDSDSIRGTYIGDVFYLTYYSGRVEAYRLADGEKVGELPPIEMGVEE